MKTLLLIAFFGFVGSFNLSKNKDKKHNIDIEIFTDSLKINHYNKCIKNSDISIKYDTYVKYRTIKNIEQDSMHLFKNDTLIGRFYGTPNIKILNEITKTIL